MCCRQNEVEVQPEVIEETRAGNESEQEGVVSEEGSVRSQAETSRCFQ